MPKRHNALIPMEWVSAVARSIGVIVFSVATFFLNQLNSNIASLTLEIKALQIREVELDKRMSSIEQWRTSNPDLNAVFEKIQIATLSIAEIKEILARNSIR